jgi:hypothetical protein
MSGANPEAGVATGPAQEVAGGPVGGGEARAPTGTTGASPAGGEPAAAATKRYRYETEYRRTRLGGFTDSIAICQVCKRTIGPVATEFSRTGRHGTDHYEHEHPLTILVLEQSNSGRRSHYFVGEEATDEAIKSIVEMAIDAWEWYRADFDDVYKSVKGLLKNFPRG